MAVCLAAGLLASMSVCGSPESSSEQTQPSAGREAEPVSNVSDLTPYQWSSRDDSEYRIHILV